MCTRYHLGILKKAAILFLERLTFVNRLIIPRRNHPCFLMVYF